MLFPGILYHAVKEIKEEKACDHFKFIPVGFFFLYWLIIHGEILWVNEFRRGMMGMIYKVQKKLYQYMLRGEYFNISFLCMA